MDGGGRVLEPLTAGVPAGAAGRSFGEAVGRDRRTSLPRLGAWIAAPLAGLVRTKRRGFVAVPLSRRLPRFAGTALVFAFFGTVGTYGFYAGGRDVAFRAAFGEPRDVLARAFGLGLETVTISGLSQITEREVLSDAGISPRASLLFLGAASVRERLEGDPLIKSASVRKLFPHELVISLVEREPYALWQRNGELHLVSADGTVIDGLRDARFATLPMVVGEGANAHATEYAALLDAAGPLRPRIRAGMMVSGRRWTLKMDNGLDVHLPELGAAAAVARLLKLDREQQILGKDVLSVDLRMTDRVVVRLSEEAAAARAEAMKKKPNRGAKGVDT